MTKVNRVKITKTWETVYFSAESTTASAKIELSLDRSTGKYALNTYGCEDVSFKDNAIELAKLKIKALAAAVKYLEENLPSKQDKYCTSCGDVGCHLCMKK